MKRAERIKELRKCKKISTAVSMGCACISFVFMSGMDCDKWIRALVFVFVFMGLSVAASFLADEYQHRIDKITRYDPWLR